MYAVNLGTLKHYLELLKKALDENNPINSPQQIYNVDESG